jgi:lysophospholipase L1-like esterase
MKTLLSAFTFILLSLNICFAQGSKTYISANDKNINYTGRISFRNPSSPVMVYPGTMVEANFTGTSLSMKAKPGSGYFMVSVDKRRAFKVNVDKNDSIVSLARQLSEGHHSVEVMLCYEGYIHRPEFRGFYIDQNARLLPFVQTKTRKIEFIGNSITCAYGIEAADEFHHFADSTENHYYSYAEIAARNLNAQSMVVARSGIGMYRNYNGNRNGDKDIMPRWYDYTLLYDSTERWNPSRYIPDVVCINLGTNDLSTHNYDINHYKSNYRQFLKHLRTIYPKAKIVMLTGSMMNGKELNDAQRVLNELSVEFKSKGDKNVCRFDFTPIDKTLGYGADCHPSMLQHAEMGGELTAYLKRIMKW